MLELFVLLCIGWFIGKTKHVNESGNNQISWLIASVLNPCLIIAAVLDTPQSQDSSIVNQAIWIGWVLYIVSILVAELFFSIKKKNTTSINSFVSLPIQDSSDFPLYVLYLVTLRCLCFPFYICHLISFSIFMASNKSRKTPNSPWQNFLILV